MKPPLPIPGLGFADDIPKRSGGVFWRAIDGLSGASGGRGCWNPAWAFATAEVGRSGAGGTVVPKIGGFESGELIGGVGSKPFLPPRKGRAASIVEAPAWPNWLPRGDGCFGAGANIEGG